MARKRAEDWKASAGTWLEPGEPAEPEAPTPARQAERLPGDGPPIIASPKSHTSSGRLLRRTTYFTPAEWGAILAAAEAETRETGERVTAAEIIRRAVWAYLVKDLDT